MFLGVAVLFFCVPAGAREEDASSGLPEEQADQIVPAEDETAREEEPAEAKRETPPAEKAVKSAGKADRAIVEELVIKTLRGSTLLSSRGESLFGPEESLYSPERTIVEYGNLRLEADSIRVDQQQLQVEAVGNVLFRAAKGEIRAEKMYFNLQEKEGKAFKAEGRYGPIFFKYRKGETEEDPSFQMVSENEVVLRGCSITTCDLAVPHYYFSAREIIVFPEDRVLMKGAILYIHRIPVFYLPVFTRSLREPSPWFFWMGYHSRLGAWVRLGYTYKHETRAPSAENEKVLETVSRGQLTLFAQEFLRRGPGGGLQYDYDFGPGRHRGQLETFYLDDEDRDVRSEDSYVKLYQKIALNGAPLGQFTRLTDKNYEPEDELDRYQILSKHRSELTDHASWLLNADYLSDSDLYDEVLDMFGETERRRIMLRRARTALTWAREKFIVRILLELKDRVGRNRVTDFSDPADVLRDFDEQPELSIRDRSDKGIPTDRWGRVTQRAPQITVSTAWMRLWNLPFYYHSDLNVFNNLDKGLNTVLSEDDAWVQGADWYHALMWRLRLAERFTWFNQVGAGAGIAHRDDREFGYLDEDDFAYDPAAGETPYYLVPNEPMGGLVFTDPETFLIGSKPFNLRQDVKDEFAYADVLSQLHARFTDALTGALTYRYRETTDDSLGDWYAEMGNRYARDDLYPFRLRENNMQAYLAYTLARPRLTTALQYFHSFIEEEERYPYELMNLYGASVVWTNQARTLNSGISANVSDRQMFHPSDPNAFVDSSLRYSAFARYSPASRLWWGNLAVQYVERLDRSLGDREYSRYTEGDNPYTISAGAGGRIGPKYVVRMSGSYRSEYGTLSRLALSLERDLHDALLLAGVVFKQDVYNTDYAAGETRDFYSFMDQMDFRIAIVPRLPTGKAIPGTPGISVLQESENSAGRGEESSLGAYTPNLSP